MSLDLHDIVVEYRSSTETSRVLDHVSMSFARGRMTTVSYTHLTLPTKRIV